MKLLNLLPEDALVSSAGKRALLQFAEVERRKEHGLGYLRLVGCHRAHAGHDCHSIVRRGFVSKWTSGAQRWSLAATAGVTPYDERALLPLYHHIERFRTQTQLTFPGSHSQEILFDKLNIRELARSLGVPVAKGRIIGPKLTAQTLIAEARLPLAIKPASSYTLD